MLRKINLNDLDIIYSLGSKYEANFKNTYHLEDYLENNIYLLYCFEEENIIKGFIIATIIENTVEILLIFVDNKYRKQKIGSNLLEHVEKMGESTLLEVSTQNIPAYNLYKKCGYEEISRRKGYYKGVDAIVMKKVN